jgi:hypothetical protein
MDFECERVNEDKRKGRVYALLKTWSRTDVVAHIEALGLRDAVPFLTSMEAMDLDGAKLVHMLTTWSTRTGEMMRRQLTFPSDKYDLVRLKRCLQRLKDGHLDTPIPTITNFNTTTTTTSNEDEESDDSENAELDKSSEAQEQALLPASPAPADVLKSPVHAVFGGELASAVRCLHCGTESITLEPFFDLSLPIDPPLLVAPPSAAPPSARRKRVGEPGVGVGPPSASKEKNELAKPSKSQRKASRLQGKRAARAHRKQKSRGGRAETEKEEEEEEDEKENDENEQAEIEVTEDEEEEEQEGDNEEAEGERREKVGKEKTLVKQEQEVQEEREGAERSVDGKEGGGEELMGDTLDGVQRITVRLEDMLLVRPKTSANAPSTSSLQSSSSSSLPSILLSLSSSSSSSSSSLSPASAAAAASAAASASAAEGTAMSTSIAESMAELNVVWNPFFV